MDRDSCYPHDHASHNKPYGYNPPMPDPQRLIKTVKRAAELFRSTPGRKGMVIELGDSCEDLLIAGDLHGNLAHFQVLLDRARLDRNPHRHLLLQELVHGHAQYPQGGCKSHQLVDLVSALKCQYPDRVHFVLGNHELSEVLDRPIVKAGVRTNALFRQGIDVAYGERSAEVYAAYTELFRSLPLAVRTRNRIFISHSFPKAGQLDGEFNASILAAESFTQLADRTDSVYALVWGRDCDETTARRFASLVDADFLIVGHMPCPDGFANPNSIQLVLDSSHYPASYCLVSNRTALSLEDLLNSVRSL